MAPEFQEVELLLVQHREGLLADGQGEGHAWATIFEGSLEEIGEHLLGAMEFAQDDAQEPFADFHIWHEVGVAAHPVLVRADDGAFDVGEHVAEEGMLRGGRFERGPRGGIIMMGKNFDNPWGRTTQKGEKIKMSAILNSGVFPGMQGGPLEHVIAAKAIAFQEALQPEFKEYGQQVMKNAQVMAAAFVQKGYKVISGGTDNHLMLLDLRSKNVTGKDAENALVRADITVNKNMVPFDTQSPMVTSGIRVGTAAITTRGFKEADCLKVIDWIDAILTDYKNEALIRATRNEINAYMENFPLYAEQAVIA